MLELKGKYNIAKVFTSNAEEKTTSQIIELCNQEFVKNSKIRIMSDCHAGAGCTIGTTMTIQDKIVPNLVGVDIGCGMYVCEIADKNLNLKQLDEVIYRYIPSGFNIRNFELTYPYQIDYKKLKCLNHIDVERAKFSIGTLGGGNHFIEIDKGENDNYYLVIHTGSRHLGKEVAEYYQNLGYKKLTDNKGKRHFIIDNLKREGRQKEIQQELKKIKSRKINKQLAYIEGKDMADYLCDMQLVQDYADLNRKAIADEIFMYMGWTRKNSFTTKHNYIDIDNMILRKGAISAQKDEKVIIPMNMRDGSLICVGKGNCDWNYSAPHGAGRIMSRKKAKENIALKDFQNSMKGIYSTSVNQSTIDESPMAYKPMKEIISNIKDTVEIKEIIKPIYNFKANS